MKTLSTKFSNPFDLMRESPNFLGFDHMFDNLLDRRDESSYPPYNVYKNGDNRFYIELALAGFNKENINIDVKPVDNSQILSISATKEEWADDDGPTYLHRGIAYRSFSREFTLATNIEVGEAKFENGLLTIELNKIVPESEKTKKIEIR